MKFFMKCFLGLALSIFSVTAFSATTNIIQIEEAIEGEPEVFFLGKSLNGSVQARLCEECPIEKYTITPKTKAFVDDKEVLLSSRAGSSKKPVLMLFDVKTKKVTRLVWFSKQHDSED